MKVSVYIEIVELFYLPLLYFHTQTHTHTYAITIYCMYSSRFPLLVLCCNYKLN